MNRSSMRSPMTPASARLSDPTAAAIRWHERILRALRWSIYLYLFFLLTEGALRKWIVPQFSNPLLIIRDPVVLLIYVLAIAGRRYPRNWFLLSLWLIAIPSLVVGALVLEPYFPPLTVALVTGYGFRSDFLHLPLIFILPAVFNLEDVKRIGRWTLWGMIPMGILMALQFRSSPDSFINRAAGLGEGQQIQTSGGKIRPPGLFSFISGAISYMTASAAFLLHAVLGRVKYPAWFLIVSGLSLVIGIAVSGSRAAVLAVGLVVATLSVILFLQPAALNRFGRTLLFVLVIGWGVSHLPIFREGVEVLTERFTEEGEVPDSSIAGGLISRTFSGFTEPFYVLNRMPLSGYGLGVGTNGAARFLVGRATFLLAENEWTRVLLESGPVLGLAFLLWRTILACRIGYLAVRAVKTGHILPLFLFGTGVFPLLNGSFGQPTSLGFAVVLNGLCLAALNFGEKESAAEEAPVEAPVRLPRRSAYAERLHRSNGGNGLTNGSSGR
jgi:hypothetical protein